MDSGAATSAAALGVRTALRRGARPAVTAARLSDLRGPSTGMLELPHRIFWQADRSIDLDVPALRQWAYETVLREAASAGELENLLDGDTLLRLWPRMRLPAHVRQAWEDRHPALRQAA